MTDYPEVKELYINLERMRVEAFVGDPKKRIDFDLDSLDMTVQQLVHKAQAVSW